jgi:hypothetical protein
MDAREFYAWMKAHPGYLFEIDLHHITGKKVQDIIKALLDDFHYPEDEEILDRLLIQVYSRQMFEDIDAVHHFKYYQYLVGKNIHDLDAIINYSLDKGICVLALRTNLAKPELVKKIRDAGLYVMCYTVNKDLAVAQKLLDSGVNTLCTDFITYKMLEENKERMGQHPFYVYYNSGSTEAVGDDDAQQLPSGNFEYKDQTLWENDGATRLRKCRFSVEGKRFVGWNMRVQIDGKQLWYCEDHMYHGKGDFEEGTTVVPHLFADEEILPKWTVKRGIKLVMVAVWK